MMVAQDDKPLPKGDLWSQNTARADTKGKSEEMKVRM